MRGRELLPVGTEIGGRVLGDRKVQGQVAPKRRGRPRKAAPVAPMPTNDEIGANNVMTARSKEKMPQGGGTTVPAATYDDEIVAMVDATGRSKGALPQGDRGHAPIAATSEIEANDLVTDMSRRGLPQCGGATNPAATNAEIGGQEATDRLVLQSHAPKRRGRLRKSVASAAPLPVDADSGDLKGNDRKVPVAGAAARRELPTIAVPATLPEMIDRLVMLQRQRRFCIATQSKLERSTEAFIVRELGGKKDTPEAERKALWAQAAAIRKAAEAGGEGGQLTGASNAGHCADAIFSSHRLIVQSAISRAPWDDFRKAIEVEMEIIAKQLPAWEWVSGVKGFGAKGLAIIVAEAGADLHNYSSREKLWKRLGLAVMDGRRQGAPGKGASAQDWLDHGYSKPRRAEIWAIVDSLFKHQWRGDKDADGKTPLKTKQPVAVPAHATGPYGEVYARRKAWTLYSNTIVTPKHKDNDARRILTKALIEDLWRVWRGMPVRARQGSCADEPMAEAA